ncbi:MAG: SDR family NAD(P)-dependent oxidoreductase [Saprospirales bacterium]|nr:SDR family NAD(P)-dependent oxidoreductase [Saprospirales bacterium]MBK7337945.1 SDR family NAD(P)-dependent oxidoreductase [Saprospirales bacterium]
MSNVLITGANGNLGRSVVERLHRDGFKLAASLEPGSEVPDEWNDLSVQPFEVDLMSSTSANEFVAKAIAKMDGRITSGILLVGGFSMDSVTSASISEMEKMFRLNFLTAYNVVKPLMEHFESSMLGGRFILVGARPALDPAAAVHNFSYALSKSLIFRLAEIVNAHGKGKDITASVIVPSILDTPVNRISMPKSNHEDWVPTGTVADAIAYLLSESGSVLRETVLKLYSNG